MPGRQYRQHGSRATEKAMLPGRLYRPLACGILTLPAVPEVALTAGFINHTGDIHV